MIKSAYFNIGNLYMLLWALYRLKGILYEEGSFINKALLFLLFVISFFELIWVHNDKSPDKPIFFLNGINALMILYTIYGIILFFTDGLMVKTYPSIYFLEGAYMSFLPMYACYALTKKGYITLNSLQVWMLSYLIIGILEYYKIQMSLLNTPLNGGVTNLDITNNGGYVILSLIPGLLVYKEKPLIMYAAIVVCLLFITISMKRGAILISALLLILILRRNIKTNKKSAKIIYLLFSVMLLIAVYLFVESMISTNATFNARIEDTLEGDSSNRDIIYKRLWNSTWESGNWLTIIFGSGALSTLKYFNVFAHNDWLEIFVNSGILGAVFFLYFWKNFYKEIRFAQHNEDSKFCLIILFILYFIKSLFSMSITGITIYSTLIFGFSLANGFPEKSPKPSYI